VVCSKMKLEIENSQGGSKDSQSRDWRNSCIMADLDNESIPLDDKGIAWLNFTEDAGV
jgi:hypothetical protein